MAKLKGLKKINKIINDFTKENFGVRANLDKEFLAYCRAKRIGYTLAVETEDINLIYSIHNYDVIDKLVKEELGIDKFMKDFLKGFEEKIDASMQNLDLNGAVKELSKIAEGQKTTSRKKKAE